MTFFQSFLFWSKCVTTPCCSLTSRYFRHPEWSVGLSHCPTRPDALGAPVIGVGVDAPFPGVAFSNPTSIAHIPIWLAPRPAPPQLALPSSPSPRSSSLSSCSASSSSSSSSCLISSSSSSFPASSSSSPCKFVLEVRLFCFNFLCSGEGLGQHCCYTLRIALEMVVSWIQFSVQLVEGKLSFESSKHSFINIIFGAAIEKAVSTRPSLCLARMLSKNI